MPRSIRVVICGDGPPEVRSDCPNPLHDWPLPPGYVAASCAAEARLRARWSNLKCADCGLYGWVPSLKTTDSCRAIHVPYQPKPETTP